MNSLTVWFLGDLGVTRQIGVAIAPGLTPAWLYPRIVWGGIWGMLFLLPLWKSKVLSRGIIYSLVPTAVQLLYIFPVLSGKGLLGMGLGELTPFAVIFFNGVWGLTTAVAIRLAR
ncbi:MAG: hypothetical protein ACN4GW_08030 [Desulforhopalus sp.]